MVWMRNWCDHILEDSIKPYAFNPKPKCVKYIMQIYFVINADYWSQGAFKVKDMLMI